MRQNALRLKEQEELERKRKEQERLDAQKKAALQILPNQGDIIVLDPPPATPKLSAPAATVLPIEPSVPVLESDADMVILEEIQQADPMPHEYQHEVITTQQTTDPRHDFSNDHFSHGGPSTGMVEYFPTGSTSATITNLEDRPGQSNQVRSRISNCQIFNKNR